MSLRNNRQNKLVARSLANISPPPPKKNEKLKTIEVLNVLKFQPTALKSVEYFTCQNLWAIILFKTDLFSFLKFYFFCFLEGFWTRFVIQ